MRETWLQENAEGDVETRIRGQAVHLGEPGKLAGNKYSGWERRKPINKGYVHLVKAMVFQVSHMDVRVGL